MVCAHIRAVTAYVQLSKVKYYESFIMNNLNNLILTARIKCKILKTMMIEIW